MIPHPITGSLTLYWKLSKKRIMNYCHTWPENIMVRETPYNMKNTDRNKIIPHLLFTCSKTGIKVFLLHLSENAFVQQINNLFLYVYISALCNFFYEIILFNFNAYALIVLNGISLLIIMYCLIYAWINLINVLSITLISNHWCSAPHELKLIWYSRR